MKHTEINKKNLFALLRQIEMASSVVYAKTNKHGRPGNLPTACIPKGFPDGATCVAADNDGLNFYASPPVGSSELTHDEFVAHCSKRWKK